MFSIERVNDTSKGGTKGVVVGGRGQGEAKIEKNEGSPHPRFLGRGSTPMGVWETGRPKEEEGHRGIHALRDSDHPAFQNLCFLGPPSLAPDYCQNLLH